MIKTIPDVISSGPNGSGEIYHCY